MRIFKKVPNQNLRKFQSALIGAYSIYTQNFEGTLSINQNLAVLCTFPQRVSSKHSRNVDTSSDQHNSRRCQLLMKPLAFHTRKQPSKFTSFKDSISSAQCHRFGYSARRQLKISQCVQLHCNVLKVMETSHKYKKRQGRNHSLLRLIQCINIFKQQEAETYSSELL